MEGLGVSVASARIAEAHRRVRARVDPARLLWPAFALLLVAGAAFLLFETRGTTLWFDEWEWALGRRGNDIGTFLRPHNSHLSLIPIAIYRVLFATAGLSHYAPYRVLVTAGHLLCVTLLFIYARRRVGDFLALMAAALILFLGPAWQNILWPFQIAWLISLAAGIGVLLALDRHDRRGDLAACLLLLVSLASSSLDVAVLAGAIIEVLWRRRWPGEIWIVAIPLIAYLAWTLGYQQATVTLNNILLVPEFVATAAAASTSALLGLGGNPLDATGGTLLTFGFPLVVAALAVAVWRIRVLGVIAPRVVTVTAMILAFWVLIALGRGSLTRGYDSRYLYVGGLFLVLLAVELAAGARVSFTAGLVLLVLKAAAVISNIGAFRAGGAFLRAQAPLARADLGALDLASAGIGPSYLAAHFPSYPFIVIRAGPYFAAERAIGSPAYSAAQLTSASESARTVADGELIDADRVGLTPAGSISLAGRPSVDGSSAGTAAEHGACVTFQGSYNGAFQTAQIQLTVPPRGLLLSAADAPATVNVRRFATAFQRAGTLPAGARGVLRPAPDRSSLPWHVQLVTQGRASACAVS